MADLLLCPECVAHKTKSRVDVNYSTSTAMAIQSYYDESGVYHCDDPNILTTYYTCSFGHKFQIKRQYGKVIK